ncbi:MAG: A24 family peptidase C-terminal domain-containing protein [Desulfurococcaceae archaeon]
MLLSEALLYFRIIYTVVFLTVFTIYDVKYRDVPDKLVYATLTVSIVLFLTLFALYFDSVEFILFLIYLVFSLVAGLGVFLLIFKLGYIGKADVFIIAELTLLFPYRDIYSLNIIGRGEAVHLPPIIPIVLYSNILSLMFIIFKSTVFAIKYRKFLPRELPIHKRLLLVVFGRPMSIAEYLKSKHYYPLTLFRIVEGRVVKTYRLTFHVEAEDHWVHQNELKKLIDNGFVNPNDYIWVTYGVPYMLPLLITIILVVLVGDYPLLYLFKLI